MEGDFMGFLIQTLKSYYLNVRRYFRIFRLDDKLYWMKEILIAVIVSMIQLIYEYVDPDKIFFLSNSLKSTNDINFITDFHGSQVAH